MNDIDLRGPKDRPAIFPAFLTVVVLLAGGTRAQAPSTMTTAQGSLSAGASASSVSAGRVIQIDSFSQLEQLTPDIIGIFVFLPEEGGSVADAPAELMQSAADRLSPLLDGGSVGVFALIPESSDHRRIGMIAAVPGVLVAVRGREATFVTGVLTEQKFLDAFALAASAGVCGPAGCM